MPAKTRAPRNRTLTLTSQELRALQESAVKAPSKSLSLAEIRNNIFRGDLFRTLPHLPDRSIDLLFIDPPYNLTKNYGPLKFQSRPAEDYEAWFRSWFVPLLGKLKPRASVYVCCDWKTSVSVYKILSEHLFVRNRITWEREKGRGNALNWKNSSEDIWYATVSETDFTFNVDQVKLKKKVIAPYKESGRPKDWHQEENGNFRLTHPSNLWTDLSIPFWSMPENTDHPTQKPEKLLAKLILASSRPGDLVFDPFMGSGTTAVVAKKLARDFSGVEINPEYHAWAQKRLEKADSSSKIQGYSNGVFWERNSSPELSD
ncbi:MAG TPA: site-specific DNA-methyltransferase [Pseudobdellovibrionaceae bacterium]|nr:site-specific DNA-methyltransferase [Pseudobdellovibrionaceae bacterium]